MSSSFEKVVRVESHNTGLIRLRNISKYTVHHTNKHTVFKRVTGVLNNGDDIGSGFGHVEEITSGSVGELDRIHISFWSHNVGYVRHRCTGSSAEVKHLGAGFDPDVIDSA